MNKTQTNYILQVNRDGEPDPDYLPKEPTILERTLSHVQARIAAFSRELATQTRLQFFDLRMGTHYAKVRRNLRREVKKERICKETGIYDLLRVTGHRV